MKGECWRVAEVIQGSHCWGIVNLRELEPRTGHSPCRHSLIVQDSVDGLSAGMQPHLAYVDNTPAIHIFRSIGWVLRGSGFFIFWTARRRG